MKTLLLALLFLLTFFYGAQAQTVQAQYLQPMFTSPEVSHVTFGSTGNGYGGLVWNNAGTFYGDGNDFGLYTSDDRDMILATRSGRMFLNTTKVGISTHNPQAKLHIPNGDIIVGGMEGVQNTLNSSLFIKSRADNSSTYPLYIGKYGSGQDLFWVRGEGNGYLRGSLGIGTNTPQGLLQVSSDNNPTIVIGASNTTTGGASTLRFYAGQPSHSNSFYIQYNKSATTDRLGFFDGNNAEVLTLRNGGRVGIGTANPDATLTVKGDIHTREIRVDLTGETGPDYVFEKDYHLLPLAELEAYIKANKHLPEVPSAKEMEQNGLDLKEMNLLLLKKVEELTLHLIEIKKENAQIADLKKRIEALEKAK